jgi:hypothetical protein
MPGKHNKPMMGHKPKMAHGKKPKMSMDVSKATEKQKKMFQAIMDNNRAKMAMRKMIDDKNFPKMAQDMADVLVQKMDGAKMYKPTKYHDGPKMAHGNKPKMYGNKPMDHKKGHSGSWTYTSSNGNTTEIRIGSKDDTTLKNDAQAQVQRKKQLDKIKTS